MQPHAVLEADDVLADVTPYLTVVGILALLDMFHLQVRKKRSMTELSQQLQLMLQTMR
jgi:hypothetical protein